MSSNQTIVFFSGYFLPFLGGIERYTDKLTSELVKLGYRVIIVTTNHDHLPAYEEKEGRSIYRFPSKNLFKQRYPILDKNDTYHRLYQQLKSENTQYVICNTRFQLTTLLGLKYAKQKKLPCIVLDHGSSHFTVNNRFLDFFGAIYEHLLTQYIKCFKPRFFSVSNRSSEWLRHFHITSSGVIYNSVPDHLYDDFKEKQLVPKKEHTFFVTYAGRILKEKGVELLLEAFKNSNFPRPVELFIAGDGPILENLKQEYPDQNIHFLGKLNFEETMSLMAETDIFVYPSMYPEGLPTSILEAGLLGCAIIATDRGGTTEVIKDSTLGLIIEENAISLQKALCDLIKDDQKRKILQENIQKRIKEHFVWGKTANHLIDVLNEIEK